MIDVIVEIIFWGIAIGSGVSIVGFIWAHGYFRGQLVAWREILEQDKKHNRKLRRPRRHPKELYDKDRRE